MTLSFIWRGCTILEREKIIEIKIMKEVYIYRNYIKKKQTNFNEKVYIYSITMKHWVRKKSIVKF